MTGVGSGLKSAARQQMPENHMKEINPHSDDAALREAYVAGKEKESGERGPRKKGAKGQMKGKGKGKGKKAVEE